IIIIEADYDTAPYLHTGLLNAVHLVEHAPTALTQVLKLFGLAQCCFIGGFDTDENADEVGLDHELHQLCVVAEINTGFGPQCQRKAGVYLPGDDIAQYRFDRPLVADQIVVDNKGSWLARRDQRVELGEYLRRTLDPRATAKGNDDVAELAFERAAAR